MGTALAAISFWYYDAGAVALTAVWDDPDNSDTTLSNGDTLTITFDTATDRPGGTGVQTKNQVDSMFSFERSLGAGYTGQWISTTQFRITITDATGGTAQIGDDVSRQSNSFRIFALDTTGGVGFVGTRGVAVNSTDFIFASDLSNNNVQIFNPDGTFVDSLDTTGGTAFDNPLGVATNSTDFIFVADEQAISGVPGNVQIFNPDGTFVDSLDTTGGTAFADPWGVATNSTGFIFVSDTFNNNVQIFDRGGTFAGSLTGTAFTNPVGISTNSTDFIFVADETGNIKIFRADGTYTGVNLDTTGGTAFVSPEGVATNSTNFIFVSDSQTVNPGNVQIFRPDGTFAAAQPTTGGTAFADPQLIAIDSDDRLIVPDSSTDLVQVFGPASIQNTAETSLVFTNTITTSGDFGALPVSSGGGGGGGGDSTPPSFTTGFSEGEPVLQINGDSFATGDLDSGTQGTITAEQDEQVSFDITLYDGGGPGNIRHVDLFFNKQGEQILNDLDETYVTYDEGQTTIHDPSGMIQSAKITRTSQGNKAVFSFDITFSKEMEKSDILIRAWDLRRNVVYLHANNIIQIMPSQPAAGPPEIQQQDVKEPQTQEQLQTAEKDIAEQDLTIRQWAGYHTESATDAQLVEAIVGEEMTEDQTVQIPGWVSGDVAEWYVSGKITYDEFVVVIQYLYDYGLLVSESEGET